MTRFGSSLAALTLVLVSCLAVPVPLVAPYADLSAVRALRLGYVHMIDGAVGWAISETGAIVRTIDGGQQWTNVTPRGQPIILADVAFLTGRLAIVVAIPSQPANHALVFRTADGGQSWRSVIVTLLFPNDIRQLTFVDARHGWLFAAPNPAAGSQASQVLRTSDGGARWDSVAVTDPPGQYTRGGLPFVGDKSGLGFSDASTGFATGPGVVAGDTYLYVTHDGGRTWRYQSLPLPTEHRKDIVSLDPPAFFTPHDGAMQGHLSSGQTFFVTHDGGKTWAATTPLPSPLRWSYLDVRQWVAFAGGSLYTTGDSGQHWTMIDSNLSTLAPRGLKVLIFVTTRIGYGLSVIDGQEYGALLHTTDAGHTWSVLHPYQVS